MTTVAHRSIAPACRLGFLLCALLFSAPLLAQRDNGHGYNQAAYPPGAHRQVNPWQERHLSSRQLADKWEDKHKDRDKKERKRFESLSPEDREKLRERREVFKSLPPEERERIERAREKFRSLPPERREELKEKWRNMSPEQRKEYHRRMENDERYRNDYYRNNR
ncbi:DUF3106 domain-containing protein [Porticoccus sp.]